MLPIRVLLIGLPLATALGGAPAASASLATEGGAGASIAGPAASIALFAASSATAGAPRATPAAATRAERSDAVRPGSGVWPLSPRPLVQQRFDPPSVRWGRGHRGVDLAGRTGQPVSAALAGRVTYAGRLAGRGVVVVDHGSTRSTYEPVTASVRVGDSVSAGARIGRLELFGSHCFPRSCLHWGLIEGRDHYLDPLLLVGAVPVILLPLTDVPVSRTP